MFIYILIAYLIIINFIAFSLTYYDKKASKTNRRRIRENTLILVALLGGSIAMYITMKLMHHKTRHSLFMVGIPFIFIVEVLIAIFVAVSSHIFN
jgi:uncharacterized membrane protein YsdA (DUF1294 family)